MVYVVVDVPLVGSGKRGGREGEDGVGKCSRYANLLPDPAGKFPACRVCGELFPRQGADGAYSAAQAVGGPGR